MFATDTFNYSSYRSAEQINTAMSRVYFHMMMAIITSMAVSFLISTSQGLMTFLFTGMMKYAIMFLPLIAVIGFSVVLAKGVSKEVAQIMLHAFAAIMGLSFAPIFIIFTGASITMAFMSAAILFGTMSLYGYFTKKSLDSLGKFMFVGLIAIILASIVNIFIGSSVLGMVISSLAIIVFLGLTAYDTQKIREMVSYENSTGTEEIQGALTLYLDFINIFLSLLQLFGDKKD